MSRAVQFLQALQEVWSEAVARRGGPVSALTIRIICAVIKQPLR